jgi:hypothetical protein
MDDDGGDELRPRARKFAAPCVCVGEARDRIAIVHSIRPSARSARDRGLPARHRCRQLGQDYKTVLVSIEALSRIIPSGLHSRERTDDRGESIAISPHPMAILGKLVPYCRHPRWARNVADPVNSLTCYSICISLFQASQHAALRNRPNLLAYFTDRLTRLVNV